ncbi:acyl carrier protein [Pedobacter deserti]|uniref:acyl carrier protein n=1 Tax=Pedobacter deserti TaxID=2817382 RepID=UPI00210DA22E|nr:acyl carrier protein [Pedobacter sp. SYSU D00382]
MDNQSIISRLKPILDTYVEDKALLQDINEDTDFIRDLKINSANLVDIVLDVEEAFGIVIDNAAMERMLTIGAAITIIKEQLNQ